SEWLRRRGTRQIPLLVAAAVLGRLLATRSARMLVADVDWSLLAPIYETIGRGALFERLPRFGEDEPAADLPDLRTLLQDAVGTAEQRRMIVEHVRQQVAAVLGTSLADEEALRQGFFELGMDSMTSLELHRRLAKSVTADLPATLAFDHPNIIAVADYLC